MNTTPTIKVTNDGAIVGVATARLLLQHAIRTEARAGASEGIGLPRKRAINHLTGASIQVPTEHPAEAGAAGASQPRTGS